MIILIFTNAKTTQLSHRGWFNIRIHCHHIIACICASSVQSTGGDEGKPYYISTVAGNGTGTLNVNAPALDATFGGINCITQSKNGDLFVASKHDVVLKLSEFLEGTWSNVTIIAGTGSHCWWWQRITIHSLNSGVYRLNQMSLYMPDTEVMQFSL